MSASDQSRFEGRPRIAMFFACAMTLVFVALLAALHLPYPFTNDQALFTHLAKAISAGARLYVDIWDIKQPGLYGFYYLGGVLFGFNEIGIHSLDLLWNVALAAVLFGIAARWRSLWLAALTPAICLGPFYAAARPWHLTQVEIIVCLPIALVVMLMLQTSPGQRGCAWKNALAAGLTISVALLKFVLVVVPAAIIAAAWLRWLLVERISRQRLARDAVLPAVLAAATALAGAAAVLTWLGILEGTIWITFGVPRLILEQFPSAPAWRMREGIEWFLGATWPLIILAMFGAYREIILLRSALGWTVAAWIVSASAAILLQRNSWWPYHLDIFFVPIGLLAVTGIQQCVEGAKRLVADARLRSAIIATLCAAILVATVVRPIVWKIREYWLAGPSPFADPVGFSNRVDGIMRKLRDSAAFLDRPGSLPGQIAVFGDARVFFLTNRRPILFINGTSPFLPHQIERSARLLEQEQPAYVYMNPPGWQAFAAGSDAVINVLERDYVEHSRDERDGLWCERRLPRQAAKDQSPAPARPCHPRDVAALARKGE